MGGKRMISIANTNTVKKKQRPALTPEGRENQLISLAIDRAEQQLRDGTASSQVIVHYLKLGSSREKLEQEQIIKNQELIDAKKENLISGKVSEELYTKAIKAMRSYGPTREDDEEDVEYTTEEPF